MSGFIISGRFWTTERIKEPKRKVCDCCPYGYHIDLDFVQFCEAFSKSHLRKKDTSRYSGQSNRKQCQTIHSLLGIQSRHPPSDLSHHQILKSKDTLARASPDVQQSLQKAVQDFEEALIQSTSSCSSNITTNNNNNNNNNNTTDPLFNLSTISDESKIFNETKRTNNASKTNDYFDTNYAVHKSPINQEEIPENSNYYFKRIEQLEQQLKLIPKLQAHVTRLEDKLRAALNSQENEKTRIESSNDSGFKSFDSTSNSDLNETLSSSREIPKLVKVIGRDVAVSCSLITRDIGHEPKLPQMRNMGINAVVDNRTSSSMTDEQPRFHEKEKETHKNNLNLQQLLRDEKRYMNTSTQTVQLLRDEKRHMNTSTQTVQLLRDEKRNMNTSTQTVQLLRDEKRHMNTSTQTVQLLRYEKKHTNTSTQTVFSEPHVKAPPNRYEISTQTCNVVPKMSDKSILCKPNMKSISTQYDKYVEERTRRSVAVSTVHPSLSTHGTQTIMSLNPDKYFNFNKEKKIKTESFKDNSEKSEGDQINTATKTDDFKLLNGNKKIENDKCNILKNKRDIPYSKPLFDIKEKEDKVVTRHAPFEDILLKGSDSHLDLEQIGPVSVQQIFQNNKKRAFTRQNTYTKIPEVPTPDPPVISQSLSARLNKLDNGSDKSLNTTSNTIDIKTDEIFFEPISSRADDRTKAELSKEVKAAAKVLNDSLKRCSSLQAPMSNMNNAISIVQEEWFKISSLADSNVNTVEDYLDAFEEISTLLLEYVVNMRDGAGNTAMHYAVSHGNFDVVSALLESKVCNVNIANEAGYTCTMLVSLANVKCEKDQEIVKHLFTVADINVKAKKHGQTTLMLAVSHGKMNIVRLLVECGADINIQDDDGSTALMCAAEHGHLDIVNFLASHPDCDLSIKDNDGGTALTIAMEAGHREVGISLYAKQHFNSLSPHGSTKEKRSRSANPILENRVSTPNSHRKQTTFPNTTRLMKDSSSSIRKSPNVK